MTMMPLVLLLLLFEPLELLPLLNCINPELGILRPQITNHDVFFGGEGVKHTRGMSFFLSNS